MSVVISATQHLLLPTDKARGEDREEGQGGALSETRQSTLVFNTDIAMELGRTHSLKLFPVVLYFCENTISQHADTSVTNRVEQNHLPVRSSRCCIA